MAQTLKATKEKVEYAIKEVLAEKEDKQIIKDLGALSGDHYKTSERHVRMAKEFIEKNGGRDKVLESIENGETVGETDDTAQSPKAEAKTTQKAAAPKAEAYTPKEQDKHVVHLEVEQLLFSEHEYVGEGMNITKKKISKPYVLKITPLKYEMQFKDKKEIQGLIIHRVLYIPK